MRTGIIGTKIGNTSFFNDDGSVIPVTVVKIDDCVVSQIKTIEKNGYFALQLASVENNLKIHNVKKPQRKIFSAISFVLDSPICFKKSSKSWPSTSKTGSSVP